MREAIKRTRFILKKSDYWKKRFLKFRIGIYLLSFVLVFANSMLIGNFNVYYYFLDTLKIIIFFSMFMASAYFVVADRETFNNWQDRSYRNKDLLGKLVLAVFEGIIFLIITTAIYGIFHLSGFPYNYEQEHYPGGPSTSPLRFSPSPIEGLLFAFIIILQLVAIFTSIYWYYARCWKVIGFNTNKNVVKISLRFLIGLVFNASFWILSTLLLDHVYFNFIYPDAYSNFHVLDNSIFAAKPYLYLIVQLGILVIFNLINLIDGIIANKRRTNFIELDPLEPYLEDP